MTFQHRNGPAGNMETPPFSPGPVPQGWRHGELVILRLRLSGGRSQGLAEGLNTKES